MFDTDPDQGDHIVESGVDDRADRGRRECRWHDFRHTCISRLLERGVPLSVVASLMGWSPATTTRMANGTPTSATRRTAKRWRPSTRGAATPTPVQVDAPPEVH